MVGTVDLPVLQLAVHPALLASRLFWRGSGSLHHVTVHVRGASTSMKVPRYLGSSKLTSEPH